jgi:hypothetical protein
MRFENGQEEEREVCGLRRVNQFTGIRSFTNLARSADAPVRMGE